MEAKSPKLLDLAEDERPREKLIQRGRAALSDEELIAIFLRTGLRGCNVLELAARLKRAAGSLTALGSMEAREIAKCCKGIGSAKAATLAAVFELGQRAVKENLKRIDMGTPAAVYEYLAGELRYEQQEHFVALMLDSRRHLIRRCTISKGTINRTMVHPRDVFREAITSNAASIILAHNHPSGDVSPSKLDRELTRELVNAGDAMHIPITDHLIIGTGSTPYYSFREHGFIQS
ncbi:MAG: DNA repair protein RadC [Akkermansia sp.]|nr:DNA repair protein RadC [Akkermansia sp.]